MARSVNTRLAMEAVRHRLFLSRYGQGQARKMMAVLKRMNLDVSIRLAAALEDSNVNASNYTVQRLTRIKKAIQPTIDALYRQVWGQLAADLQEFAKGELIYQVNTLANILPRVVLDFHPVKEIPYSQLWAAANSRPFQGVLLQDVPRALGADLVNKIGNAVQMGILQGETYDQITRRVRGSAASGYNDGLMGNAERSLATITRSAVSHVAAEARDQIGDANAAIIKCEKWLSTLDSHTSKLCIVRDQLLYDRKTKAPIGHKVPYGAGPGRLHFNCRSTSVYELKGWDELGIPGFKIKGGTRASMNGQVSDSMNFGTWVKGQSMATLTDVFGVERAQLIRDGKIEPPQLFSDKGEYLTLAQLRALDRIPDDD